MNEILLESGLLSIRMKVYFRETSREVRNCILEHLDMKIEDFYRLHFIALVHWFKSEKPQRVSIYWHRSVTPSSDSKIVKSNPDGGVAFKVIIKVQHVSKVGLFFQHNVPFYSTLAPSVLTSFYISLVISYYLLCIYLFLTELRNSTFIKTKIEKLQ